MRRANHIAAWGGLVAMGAAIVAGGCAAKRTASAESEPEAPVISQSQPSKPLQAAPLAAQAAPTQSVNSSQPAPAIAEWTTPFPHVAVNRAARQVRVNGFVPIDAHNEKTPRVFLEVLVCSRNTKEHEALVVTDAKPSHVHAAMLMIGLEPGAPGSWRWAEGAAKPEAIAPNGPRIRVTVRPEGGQAVDIREWVVQRDGATRLPAHEHLVFAGSIFRTLGAPGEARAIYGADADGTIVGLTAFGTETIAWSGMYHHETAMEQPAWMADAARMPKFGTDVEVLIEPIAP